MGAVPGLPLGQAETLGQPMTLGQLMTLGQAELPMQAAPKVPLEQHLERVAQCGKRKVRP